MTDIRNTISGYSETYSAGNYVKLKHANGYTTEYYHMAKGSVCVKIGDTVDKGQVIGYMGSTGWSTGNHLHFGIRINGATVDPEPYLLGTKSIPPYGGVLSTGIIGTPVAKDTARLQAEILIATLRARKRPELSDEVVLGYIKPGVYNVLEQRDMTHEASNGYLWLRVDSEIWIAYKPEWIKLLEPSATPTAKMYEFTAKASKGDVNTLAQAADKLGNVLYTINEV